MNLRQAAEMALKALENMSPDTDTLVEVEPHVWEYRGSLVIQALRQALDLQTTIEKGTKAWADVPNATEWAEELRGNTPDCKTHPDAPHGFDRNASHSADRYVCECEGWEPPKREWVGLTDDEIWDIGVDNQRKGGGFWGYPRAIEAKLKEKNT
jgi:hypothetical protein